jgi:multidrug efflux pump subunit AcrA (membrane-fusion protein)
MENKMLKRSIAIAAINLSLILILLSGLLLDSCSNNKTLAPAQSVAVKRGDINIVVTSNGNLTAPYDFKLAFGTQGIITKILVNDGDKVREGALLATLDDRGQKDQIERATFNVQTAQNNITFGCDTDHLPYNYPDLSVPRMADEAKKDIATAAGYFKQGKYSDAGYWLVMTYFDIEVCQELITSKPDAAVLAGAKTNSTYYPNITAGSSVPIPSDNQKVVDYLQQYRQKLLDISNDMKDEKVSYDKIAVEFDAAQQEMITVSQMASSTISIKDRFVFKYADTPTSVDFLQSSLRSLQDVEKYLSPDNADLTKVVDNLYIAKLKLQIARDVLENRTLTFESGGSINWKTLQTYNLSLQSAETALYQAKQQIMQTAIIAPSNGTVESVNLKVNYSLSSINFSSSPAVEVVDTSRVRFKGTVDEIDIMKVKPGQKADITVDAVPDKVFTGTVTFISPFGTQVGSVIKFAVQILLDLSPTDAQLLRGGLSATATINIASAKNALLVPVSMIINTPGGPMVMVMNETTGKPERRRITLGIQDLEFAEVLSGLKEGEKVQAVSQTRASSASTTQSRQGQGATNPMRILR